MNNIIKKLHHLLGLDEETHDAETLRQAFRRKARIFHPDVSTEANAAAKFDQVKKAYDILTDPKRRKVAEQGVPDEKQDLDSIARNQLIDLFRQAVDAQHPNPLEGVKHSLREARVKRRILAAEKNIKRIRNVRNHIKKTGDGEDIFAVIFENKISELEDQLRTLALTAAVEEIMWKMLTDYSFIQDSPELSSTIGNYSPLQHFSSDKHDNIR